MDLSVIIVSFNTKDLLRDSLKSVYQFTKGINFEVIVVDNASADGSIEMVKKEFPKVKVIENKKNLGFGAANNLGAKEARGKYLMLLNSDAYLVENSFDVLVKEAETVENLGILASKIANPDMSIQQSVGFFPSIPKIFFWMSFVDDLPGGQHLKPYHVDHDSFYKKEQAIDWATAAAVLIPKAVFEKVGGFDENIFMYGEEVELAYRIKQSGLPVIYTPRTKIVHIGRGSSGKIPKAAFIGEYKGLKYFYKKHKSVYSLQIARFLLKIGALLRIFVFSLQGRRKLAQSYVEAFKSV